MKKINLIYPLLLLIMIVFSNCSKDEGSEETNSNLAVTSQNVSAKIPSNLSNKSPETSAEIQSMIAMMTLTEGFANSKPAAKTTGKSTQDGGQTWIYDGYTINYSETLTQTQYQFSYSIKKNNTTYYTINGWVNKNGSAGHWDLYIPAGVAQSTDYTSVDFDWTKNNSNDYYLDMVTNFGGYFTSKIVANVYNNGSGDLSSYYDGELEFKSMWNANGTGSYIDYSNTPPTTTYF